MAEFDDAVRQINDKLDWMGRVSGAYERRERNAADAGFELAQAVYAYSQDPQGVGTDVLEAARLRFMQAHAGGFVAFAV